MAQNGQAMPHPACEEMQTVNRSGYRMSTLSTSVPSCRRHNVLRVVCLVGLDVPHLGEQRRQQRGRDLLTHGGGEVGHGGGVALQPPEVLPGQLVGAEPGQAELDGRLPTVGGGEVGEVPRRLAAAGGVEDERERGHGAPHCP